MSELSAKFISVAVLLGCTRCLNGSAVRLQIEGDGMPEESAGQSRGRGDRQGVRNSTSADVRGSVVQTGVVHGNVHFHAVSASGDVPLPHEVPYGPDPLLGRNHELGVLDGWLSRGDRRLTVAALSGSGGIGKTALAASWMHSRSDEFPEGQLYAELGTDGSGEPVSASEILGRFLRSLGVPSESIPIEPADRIGLYRSMTAGRSLQVLLDNATSAAQVRALLPNSPGSLVVVTSSARLAGLALDGARFLDVGPLAESSGMRLLAEVIGENRVDGEPEIALELVRLCSGFPLAIVVVGARMSTHPGWSISDVVEQLSSVDDRFSALSLHDDVSMESVFDLSYEAVSEQAAFVYRALSVCPGEDFSSELVRAVVGPHVDDVRDPVWELVEANLLVEKESRRFRFHDLIRAHARLCGEREDSAEQRDAARRLAMCWYLGRAAEADRAVNPLRERLGSIFASDTDRSATDRSAGFASAEAALDWYERERSNLLAVLHSGLQLGWDELVWQWCEVMWSFFLYRKWYDDWIQSHRAALGAAERVGSPLGEVRVRCQLGFAYLDLGRYEEAADVCAPALSLAEETGHANSISTALSQLAKAARGEKRFDEALAYLRRALRLAEGAGNRRSIALRLRRLGAVLADLHRYEEAVEHLRQSIDLLSEIGDQRGRARALTVLGRIQLEEGRLEEAGDALRASLEGMADSGSPSYVADVHVELATVAERGGDAASAREHLEIAEGLYRQSQHPSAASIQMRLNQGTGTSER
ncbi:MULTISPECIES: tetratricopeptide repeat protein [unclassified Saccharopolyspora]|uniref:ATP-binding protein n=1 Tax=unclassified Saccharopolyspora TaxID=2646250 RepID=UPI001CD53423|nr:MULTISPECIES: tetratricopeptide repeat protein [unclassified Saccharopolyspora]MCA1188974.1 tetratricopeptide repeat protein [Saccharopolyspora sp. 6T]MCA1194850.1 tetratricopeptide repeat protein [Saccharopolyspora sp. 6V]MCA1228127.1 tetratricopeptide repeat protein [Saccharopolyspora sp. 6M]MCA1282239.1 tetratricopeptide repeat protein [Saccharopolyspora sp. 7B]